MSWVHLVWIFLVAACPLIYRSGADQQSIIIFGNIAKIFGIFVAALSLTFTVNAYNPGESAKRAWTFLASGAWLWFFAQVVFAQYKVVLGINIFPNIADIFFVIGYLPLFAGIIVLIADFRSTGLPMGSKTSYFIQAVLLMGVYAALFFKWLLPLLWNQDTPTTKFLNVGYPTCDFLLFCLTTVLIRISWVLRGGSLAKAYVFLGLSFMVTAIGDLIFAYSPVPLIDLLFFSAYFMLALGSVYQRRMMRE